MKVCVQPINDELEAQPEENNNSIFEMCICEPSHHSNSHQRASWP